MPILLTVGTNEDFSVAAAVCWICWVVGVQDFVWCLSMNMKFCEELLQLWKHFAFSAIYQIILNMLLHSEAQKLRQVLKGLLLGSISVFTWKLSPVYHHANFILPECITRHAQCKICAIVQVVIVVVVVVVFVIAGHFVAQSGCI